MKHHWDSSMLSLNSLNSFDHHYLFPVHWTHLLIQLNQVQAYEKVPEKLNPKSFFPSGQPNINKSETKTKNPTLGLKHSISLI